MKSAYELAMERLEKAHGPSKKLNDKQKARIADIETRCAAKVAEARLSFDAKLKSVTTAEEYEQVLAEMGSAVASLEEQRDREKEKVWDETK